MIDGLEEKNIFFIYLKKKKSQNSAFVNISSACTLPKEDLRGNNNRSKRYT